MTKFRDFLNLYLRPSAKGGVDYTNICRNSTKRSFSAKYGQTQASGPDEIAGIRGPAGAFRGPARLIAGSSDTAAKRAGSKSIPTMWRALGRRSWICASNGKNRLSATASHWNDPCAQGGDSSADNGVASRGQVAKVERNAVSPRFENRTMRVPASRFAQPSA